MATTTNARERAAFLVAALAGCLAGLGALWFWCEARITGFTPFGLAPWAGVWIAAAGAVLGVAATAALIALFSERFWPMTAAIGLMLTGLVFGLGPGSLPGLTLFPRGLAWNTWYLWRAVWPGWARQGTYGHAMALLAGVGILGAIAAFNWAEHVAKAFVKGERAAPAKLIRGATIVEEPRPEPTRRVIRRALREGRTVWAGRMLEREEEIYHFLALGTPGMGKSTAMQALMGTAIARGDQAVVVDYNFEAIARFGTTGDAMMNPLETGHGVRPRRVAWDLFAEIRAESDYDLLATALVIQKEEHGGGQWIQHGRDFFANILRTWHRNGRGTFAEFCEMLGSGDRTRLQEAARGTISETLFGDGHGPLSSVLLMMTATANSLQIFAGDAGAPFSVRDWVRQGRGRLWLPYRESQQDALKGPISAWATLALTELLDLPESDTRRIWVFLDELDGLAQLPKLDRTLTKVRKRGGCIALAIQTSAQVVKLYGRYATNTIVETCRNKLILNCQMGPDGGTARLASEIIGSGEFSKPTESTSRSSGRASTGTSEHRQTDVAVLPSQIAALPKFHFYRQTFLAPEWVKSRFDRVELPLADGSAAQGPAGDQTTGAAVVPAGLQYEADDLRARNARALQRFSETDG